MKIDSANGIASLLCGILFGFGLALSGMTHPEKVLNFLDVAGRWDASLLFVMGGAVSVTVVAFHFVLRSKAPLFADRFHLPQLKEIDFPLIAGAAIFGVGWGLSGYCPGPAISLLAAPNWEAAVFLPAMAFGFLLQRLLRHTR